MSLAHWLALSFTAGLGPVRVKALLDSLEKVEAIFELSREQWQAFGFSRVPRLVSLHDDRVRSAMVWQASSDAATIITWDHPAYPDLLREISDPPLCLYLLGSPLALSKQHVAMVGSRHPTSSGTRQAQAWASALAEQGLGIVSGLALGVDACAHRGALMAGGITIAVLATGVDTIYPSSHRSLAARIIKEGGALISEQALGTEARPALFPRRNRLISGLSIGTLVIEAGLRSGSLITAHQALSQNREVMAMPGDVMNPLSKGCHALLKQGAALVDSIDDVLSTLQV